jgi:hypothetical protein
MTMTEQTEKRVKKLAKEIEGNLVKITVGGGSEMVFDFDSLPADIQTKLGPFGLGHKLGDAAAGKEGQEAEEAINKVFDGLKGGDWSVRAPSGPRVSVKSLTDKLANLPSDQAAAAAALLKQLGVNIPGITD